MGRNRSNRVRSYFADDIDKNFVVCKVKTIDNDTTVKYCNTRIKHCKSTCSMINHLKIHKINFNEEQERTHFSTVSSHEVKTKLLTSLLYKNRRERVHEFIDKTSS